MSIPDLQRIASSFTLYPLRATIDDAMDSVGETRRRSAALFGNEKTVEVVLALDAAGAATAQMTATQTGISYSLVRDALIRLAVGGAVRQVPRVGGSRSLSRSKIGFRQVTCRSSGR